MVVWLMAYETCRWIHFCIEESLGDWHQLVTEEVSELFIAVSPPVALSGGYEM